MRRWEIAYCQTDEDQIVEKFLSDGWEPFAVNAYLLYFRREVGQQDAYTGKKRR